MGALKISKKVKRTKSSSKKPNRKAKFPIEKSQNYIDPGAVKADRENKIYLKLTGRDDDW